MRKDTFIQGEFYHIYNRGVEKRNIFLDDADRWRFLTLLFVLQGKVYVPQIGRTVSDVKHLVSDKRISVEEHNVFKEILSSRTVELVCFCLMPNHFHLILHEVEEKGISNFMQRLGDGYTKYFNIKHERSGHLFGGVFQSRHINQNEYLTHLSAYIHMNPYKLKLWSKKEINYPWSSFKDFKNSRWQAFLVTSTITDQFKKGEYENFVKNSNIEHMIEGDYLIDL